MASGAIQGINPSSPLAGRDTGPRRARPEDKAPARGFLEGFLLGLGLLEETVRVVPEKLLLRVRSEARPSEDVVDRLRELALRVRVVGGVHQDTVAEKPGHRIEDVLALLALDAAEEPAIRQVFARGVLQGCRAADIAGLLVHPPRPERQPAEAAFEPPPAQARMAVEDPAADERGDKPPRAPGGRGHP